MRQRSSSDRLGQSRDERVSKSVLVRMASALCSVHNTVKVFSSWFLFTFCSSSMKRTFINISGSPVYRTAAEYTIKNCSADWRKEFYPLLRTILQHFSSFKIDFQVKLFYSCPDFFHCLIFISAFHLALSLYNFIFLTCTLLMLNFFLSSITPEIADQ